MAINYAKFFNGSSLPHLTISFKYWIIVKLTDSLKSLILSLFIYKDNLGYL